MKIKEKEVENLFGSINKENIYIGDIKRCTECSMHSLLETDFIGMVDTFGTISIKSEEYLTDEVLIKFCSHPEVFIPLKDLKKLSTRLKVYQQITKDGIITRKPILTEHPSYLGDTFVDEESLKPKYKEKGKVKIKELKREAKRKQ